MYFIISWIYKSFGENKTNIQIVCWEKFLVRKGCEKWKWKTNINMNHKKKKWVTMFWTHTELVKHVFGFCITDTGHTRVLASK